MQGAVDGAGRADGAQPEAEDLAHLDGRSEPAQRSVAAACSASRATRLAGLAAAQRDPVRDRGSAAQVVVEGHDPVHVGAREVEHLGDDQHVVVGDVPVGGDDLVQHREQGPRRVLSCSAMARTDAARTGSAGAGAGAGPGPR